MVLAWVRTGRDRATAAWDRVQAARADSPTLDTAFVVVDRDTAAAGTLLAGALAYRLFLWLLPAALVAYAGLGFAASNGHAADAAHAAGLRQFTAASIEQAATDAHRSRWAALLIGAVLLYTASGHLLKGFTAASALAWHEPSRPRSTPLRTLTVVGFGLVVAGLAAAGAALRHRGALGLLALVGFAGVWAALWWLVSFLLPHGPAGPLYLVPGALLFGVGIQGLYVLTQVYFSRKIASASELYGALGGAATLLLWLFLLARLAVGAAVVNAVLWERGVHLGRGSGSPPR